MIVLLPWLGLVLLGIAGMQWGAARAAELLQALLGAGYLAYLAVTVGLLRR